VVPRHASVQAAIGASISKLWGPFRRFLSGAHFVTYAIRCSSAQASHQTPPRLGRTRRWFLEKAERDALFRPVDWNIALHQVGQSELCRLRALEDGLRNSGGEIRQPDHAADVGSRTSILTRQLVQRLAVTLQALAQVACPGNRLHERPVNARRCTIARDNLTSSHTCFHDCRDV